MVNNVLFKFVLGRKSFAAHVALVRMHVRMKLSNVNAARRSLRESFLAKIALERFDRIVTHPMIFQILGTIEPFAARLAHVLAFFLMNAQMIAIVRGHNFPAQRALPTFILVHFRLVQIVRGTRPKHDATLLTLVRLFHGQMCHLVSGQLIVRGERGRTHVAQMPFDALMMQTHVVLVQVTVRERFVARLAHERGPRGQAPVHRGRVFVLEIFIRKRAVAQTARKIFLAQMTHAKMFSKGAKIFEHLFANATRSFKRNVQVSELLF